MRAIVVTLMLVGMIQMCAGQVAGTLPQESETQRDERMAWWREARFGLFIHWGLYAIPAGQWDGQTGHGEWIRETARIPVDVYDTLVEKFNPVAFDADAWVRIARDAGMKYIVITTKHHDGFCLFDSRQTDFGVMSTPFNRDIMQEISAACRRHGLKMGWYYSIMDWHHPDYLPRRGWEADQRPSDGADFDRYVGFLHAQVTELLTGYGPIGVMWFDGEWEQTWSHACGQPLYDLCRTLQPSIIVNNRVDTGRGGMGGLSDEGFAGDFGTPEQQVPATGLPGVDWETCMTMNRHWGYNSRDEDWKSTETLIRTLVDIASKGGNFLLNVGPTAEGRFPEPCVQRLREIGAWMELNGESIYATQAGPFKQLDWGRCTQKRLDNGDGRLYLHVFAWPAGGELVIPGIFNEPRGAILLAEPHTPLKIERRDDALVVCLPGRAPDPIDSVVRLDVVGRPDVADPPVIEAAVDATLDIFVDALVVRLHTDRENVEIRYTLDGSDPTPASERATGFIRLTRTTTVSARLFRDGRAVSGVARATFTRVTPRRAVERETCTPGIRFAYYEGEWDTLPDFDALTPVKTGLVESFDLSPRARDEGFAFRYHCYIRVPLDGVYEFFTWSDDGSRLYIGDALVVDNDGLHGMRQERGRVALAAGLHPLTVTFFEKSGSEALEVWYAGPGIGKRRVPPNVLFHTPE